MPVAAADRRLTGVCKTVFVRLRNQVEYERDQATQAWRAEGLQAIKVRGMDVSYAQPGASLQAYQGILVQPVAVSFQKN